MVSGGQHASSGWHCLCLFVHAKRNIVDGYDKSDAHSKIPFPAGLSARPHPKMPAASLHGVGSERECVIDRRRLGIKVISCDLVKFEIETLRADIPVRNSHNLIDIPWTLQKGYGPPIRYKTEGYRGSANGISGRQIHVDENRKSPRDSHSKHCGGPTFARAVIL